MGKGQWARWGVGASRKWSADTGSWATGQQEAEALMASEGVLGSGAVTSLVDMVEGISHRPGQEGDASNCSNMKEWGCGL